MKRLRTGIWRKNHTKWVGIPHATAPCTLSGLTNFYGEFVAAAEENPEHVGYADFTIEGRATGVEVYCDTHSPFYSCLTIKQKTVRVEREALIHHLEGLATGEEIDDLHTEWQIRFYSPEPVPDALLRILRTVCGCTKGVRVEIDQWWT